MQSRSDVHQLTVSTTQSTYDIVIGTGVLASIADLIAETTGLGMVTDILIISNDTVFPLYGDLVINQLATDNRRVLHYIIPDGEQYKTWEMAEKILSFALANHLPRRSLIIALGGGVVGDIAGFVAAIYLRGIPFIQIPTTLLAQVDSSVGGKVAVNHSKGKNMIGSFYHPQLVLSDLNTLQSLPEREFRSGLAEVIKYGIIWDADFFAFLEQNQAQIMARETKSLLHVIKHCCSIKAEIVAMDEKEQGIRAILNFGHTIGHALESVTDYREYRHGEAVAIGMVAAAKLATDMGKLNVSECDRIVSLITQYGLPVKSIQISPDRIFAAFRSDKKMVADQVVFVLPTKIGAVKVEGLVTQTDLTLLKNRLMKLAKLEDKQGR